MSFVNLSAKVIFLFVMMCAILAFIAFIKPNRFYVEPVHLCPKGWTHVRSSCYRMYMNSTYDEGLSKCKPGLPFMPKSLDEAKNILQAFDGVLNRVWVGLCKDDGGDWMWADGRLYIENTLDLKPFGGGCAMYIGGYRTFAVHRRVLSDVLCQ
ncbi:hypothetical protein [Ranid herpesvirus 3]|uniref:C-type lectin protein n=1 Tax=Ranid herpesvirus 3 TaxID=1987509 RepID=A0A1X9T5J3_9VIRU|nr:hypothetical protein [Ranid herpesvirus 3]ARR28963.1 hypothetical protein [Ranid herpesvirus 3]